MSARSLNRDQTLLLHTTWSVLFGAQHTMFLWGNGALGCMTGGRHGHFKCAEEVVRFRQVCSLSGLMSYFCRQTYSDSLCYKPHNFLRWMNRRSGIKRLQIKCQTRLVLTLGCFMVLWHAVFFLEILSAMAASVRQAPILPRLRKYTAKSAKLSC